MKVNEKNENRVAVVQMSKNRAAAPMSNQQAAVAAADTVVAADTVAAEDVAHITIDGTLIAHESWAAVEPEQ